MHSLDGEYAPPADAVEVSLCAACLFGTVLVVRIRPGEDNEDGGWHTRAYCRAAQIAGANVTQEMPDPVHACGAFVPDPAQEMPE